MKRAVWNKCIETFSWRGGHFSHRIHVLVLRSVLWRVKYTYNFLNAHIIKNHNLIKVSMVGLGLEKEGAGGTEAKPSVPWP